MVTTRSGKRTDQRSLSNPIRRRASPLTYARSNAIIQALVDLEIWRTQLLSKRLPAEVRNKLSPSVNSMVSDSQITSVYYAARRLVTARQTSAGPWARVPNSKKQVPTDAELTEQAALLSTWHTHLHPPSPADSSGIATVSNFPAVADPVYSPHERSPIYDAINVGPVTFFSSVIRSHVSPPPARPIHQSTTADNPAVATYAPTPPPVTLAPLQGFSPARLQTSTNPEYPFYDPVRSPTGVRGYDAVIPDSPVLYTSDPEQTDDRLRRWLPEIWTDGLAETPVAAYEHGNIDPNVDNQAVSRASQYDDRPGSPFHGQSFEELLTQPGPYTTYRGAAFWAEARETFQRIDNLERNIDASIREIAAFRRRGDEDDILDSEEEHEQDRRLIRRYLRRDQRGNRRG